MGMGRITVLCLLGIAVSVATYGPALRVTAQGINDFRMMYAGARLVGSPDLYNVGRVRAVELEAAGQMDRDLAYNRLPCFALLLWPLGRLPYQAAYGLWEGLALAAAAAFALLWKIPDRQTAILACCWSVPLFGALAIGQDIPFLLLWIVLSLKLAERQRFLAAGLVFALCAAKFHLFALFPLLIIAHRIWRFALGLLAGGSALLILSFLGGGADWPRGFVTMLTNPELNPGAVFMPNLHGIFADVPGGLALEALCAAAVSALVWLAVRHTALEYGFSAVMTGGLLVSHHAYLADCALLLPAFLAIAAKPVAPWQRPFAWFLLTPVCYVFMLMGPAIWATRAALVIFLIGLAWAALRAEKARRPAPSACRPCT